VKIVWGIVMAGVGLFMMISGLMKSDFVVYRLLVARSRLLWGDHVHVFFIIAGAAVIVVGILMAIGVFGK